MTDDARGTDQENPADGQTELAVSTARAQLVSLPIAAVLMLLITIPYGAIHGPEQVGQIGRFFSNWSWIPTLLGGIIVHELLHGLTWAWASNHSMASVTMGVQWKSLTPYAHISRPIPAHAYRLGAAMPLIVLGLLPYLASLVLVDGWLLGFSLVFTIAAAGDVLILGLIRHVDSDHWVKDHPTKAGIMGVQSDH
ncbi:MAG: DUF3267 domain-containing protein [Candidatus Bipolaricaulia bacterium]